MAAKPPPAKKAKVFQVFLSSYTEKWPCIKKSAKGSYYAFCSVCSKDFKICHSGSYDIKKHLDNDKHEDLAKLVDKQRDISKFSGEGQEDTLSLKVMRAEASMATFIAKNNLSFSVADELQKMVKKIAPDSAIVRNIHCGSSKTTEIVKEMSSISKEKLVERMRSGPFSVSTDGSNDMERTKLFPLVVRTVSDSGVHSELLSVPTCDGSATGEKIFQLINDEFEKCSIPWNHCLALGCDNASVMTGQQNGVISHCKKKFENIYLAGCPLHLVHIAAEKGADEFPISVSDLLVDIFYYFKKSAVRSHRLAELQSFYGQEQMKMLKHVSTRWLSIDRCLSRLLNNWEPLKAFFTDESKRKDLSQYAKQKCEKILTLLTSRSTRLYCMFLDYTNSVFTEFLTVNQSDDSKAATMVPQCLKLIRALMVRFVKPCAFGGNKPVTDVQFTLPYNFKDDKDLLVGEKCRDFIKNRSENGLTSSKLKEFYSNVKNYFKTVCQYLLNKLPVSDPVLTQLGVADSEKFATASEDSIRFFAGLYPVLLQGMSLDRIIEQFLHLQSTFTVSLLGLENDSTIRQDEFWIKLKNFKDETGDYPYQHISTFLLGLLTIPHSSAHCERVFSSVRKIKTDQRASLSSTTLEALLVVKSNRESEQDFTKVELQRLKSCYTKALHGQ